MNYEQIVDQISQIHFAVQAATARAANQSLTLRNWLIGAYLFEYEQNGEDRAKYGEKLLETLAVDFTKRGVTGLSLANLKNCRQFALAYPVVSISQTVSSQLGAWESTGSGPGIFSQAGSTGFPTLFSRQQLQPVLAWQNADYYARLFRNLSWSQLLELSRLDDPLKRAFYEIECQKSRWSFRELKRQINSLLYERIGLSKDKDAVLKLANEGQWIESPATIIRDPYILEFLGLEEKAEFSEQQLEQALLDHLQKFLLELGRDFCFVGRQVRITVAGRHHYLDLLFFHRGLRCLIAYDLKLGEFQHEDAGQMNFYLNYLREEETREGEHPPVGVILCADKDAAEVHYATAGMDQQLFISRYLVALPSEERLRQWLIEEQESLNRSKL
jgi:predicted nuclease of restriction endonuclease-like (RecB) superfamily